MQTIKFNVSYTIIDGATLEEISDHDVVLEMPRDEAPYLDMRAYLRTLTFDDIGIIDIWDPTRTFSFESVAGLIDYLESVRPSYGIVPSYTQRIMAHRPN